MENLRNNTQWLSKSFQKLIDLKNRILDSLSNSN